MFSGSEGVKERGYENVVSDTVNRWGSQVRTNFEEHAEWERENLKLGGVGVPTLDGSDSAPDEKETSISILDRSQSPQAGTPTPSEIEAVAEAERSEEKKERLRERQPGGSTGAVLVR